MYRKNYKRQQGVIHFRCWLIFINMKKTRNLIVRITETQFKRLADVLITEQKNKSTIARAALDNYLDETSKSPEKQTQTHNKNKKPL
jgi:hypothetical protein